MVTPPSSKDADSRTYNNRDDTPEQPPASAKGIDRSPIIKVNEEIAATRLEWEDVDEPAPAKGSSPPPRHIHEPEPEIIPRAKTPPAQHKSGGSDVGDKGSDSNSGFEFMDDDGPSNRNSKPKMRPIGNKLSADAFAAPKPLAMKGLGGFSALPSIGKSTPCDKPPCHMTYAAILYVHVLFTCYVIYTFFLYDLSNHTTNTALFYRGYSNSIS